MKNALKNPRPERLTAGAAAALLACLLAACSAEQGYNAGQAWQRNQCARIPDKAEYDRCMSNTGGSYESYKRETEQK
jgi:hypothetical protein